MAAQRSMTGRSRWCAPAVVLLLLLLAGAPGLLAQYKETGTVRGGGTIEGYVRLNGEKAVLEAMFVTKDKSCCGVKKSSPRLVIGEKGGVKNAVVFLEAIGSGKPFDRSRKPVLEQHGCEYSPHVLVVPRATPVQIVNTDPILHNVHGYNIEDNNRSIFNIAQPIKGQRSDIRQVAAMDSGCIALSCDAGHPWMSGYLFIAPHPYYAVTDKDGKFVLSGVPEGTYTVCMWHEGVRDLSRETEDGKVKKYLFEEPYEKKATVTVEPGKVAPLNFDFALR